MECSVGVKNIFPSSLKCGFVGVTNTARDKNNRANKENENRVLHPHRPPPVFVQSPLLSTNTPEKKTSELRRTKVKSVFTQNNNKILSLIESEIENHEAENENNQVENETVVSIHKRGNLTYNSKSVDILKTFNDCTVSENNQKQTDNEDVLYEIENLNAIESDFGISTMSNDTVTEVETERYSPIPGCSNWNDNLPIQEAIHEPTQIKDSRSSNIIIHQNVDHHKRKVVSDNISLCNFNNSPSPTETYFQQKENGNNEQQNQNIVYAVTSNKVMDFEQMSKLGSFNTNDSEDVTVGYVFKDLNTFSYGLMKFAPGKQMVQVTKEHTVMYQVEQGQALVCLQSKKKCLEVGSAFHVPGGSLYSIENSSQTEPLILTFYQM